jgi:GT2 family glycosyltransferase
MTSSSAPAVSVVIVNWNARQPLLGCLRSLRDHPPSQGFEVVVVDNGSTDGSVEAVQREEPWVRVIANPDNRGLAAANNQGLVATSGTYVLVSNPDVEYGAGSVDALVDCLDRHPRAAFAFARLLHPDGTVQTCAGDPPTLTTALRGRAAGAAGADVRTGFWWHGWAHDEEVPIGHGGESAYAARRDVLAAIGLQDERFRLDWEGIDWVTRARERGYEIWFCPSAEVVHLGGESIRQARARWIVWSHRGMYLYFARPGRSPRALRPLLAVVIAVRAAGKLLALAARVDLYGRAHR